MKKVLLGLLVFVCVGMSASAQLNLVTQYGQLLDSATYLLPYKTAIASKQATISGTGLARFAGTAVTFDASVYLTANQSIVVTATGDATGTSSSSGTAPAIALVLATVNSNVGSFGTASSVPTIAFDAKGRATSAVNTPIVIAESAVTSLVSDLLGKQGTITLTTTGTGATTLVGNTLNVPTPVTAANNKFGEEATGSATTTITLANTPIAASLRLFKNGVRLPAAKFSLSGLTITLTDARVSTDTFSSDYNY